MHIADSASESAAGRGRMLWHGRFKSCNQESQCCHSRCQSFPSHFRGMGSEHGRRQDPAVSWLVRLDSVFRKARSRDVMYLKPVQTGYPADSDARFVTREVSNILRSSPHGIQNKVYICNHTLKASPAVHWAVKSKVAT